MNVHTREKLDELQITIDLNPDPWTGLDEWQWEIAVPGGRVLGRGTAFSRFTARRAARYEARRLSRIASGEDREVWRWSRES